MGCFELRAHSHFGGPSTSFDGPCPTAAAEALERLDRAYSRWSAGVSALGEEGLSRPVGPAEGAFAEHPMATLVLHINREVIHHGAELARLRDLNARR